jgi:hypothetical protein
MAHRSGTRIFPFGFFLRCDGTCPTLGIRADELDFKLAIGKGSRPTVLAAQKPDFAAPIPMPDNEVLVGVN